MSKITIELNEPAITQIGIEAVTDFYKTIAVDKLQLPGIIAVVTGVNSQFLNVVIDTNRDANTSPEAIKTMIDFFAKYNVPWSWFVAMSATNNSLVEQGFSLLEKVPGLYFDLSSQLPEIHMEHISVQEVGSNDDLSQWIKPLNEGFPTTDGYNDNDVYRKLNADLLHRGEGKLCHFIAYYKNELAGAATLFIGDNSVMLHNLAVMSKFQRHGIGTALALRRMAIAKQLKFKHCFLDASEDGFELYKNLGFKVHYLTKVYSMNSILSET